MNAPLVIILAAGKGTRMRSDLPKVLHAIDGVPMIGHVLRVAKELCPSPSIVVGYRASDVIQALGPEHAYVLQMEQRGTGHAVRCALEARTDAPDGSIVVMPGDHPLVTAASMRKILAARESIDAAVAFATVRLPDFEGPRSPFQECGRIIRSADGSIASIVERKDATEEQRRITEVNVSYYCFRGSWLKEHVSRIASDNAAAEYYLTDLVAAAVSQEEKILGVALEDPREGLGVNTLEQLQSASAA